jgi:hypothetical protein
MTFNNAQLSTFLSVATEAARYGAAELEAWRSKFSVREKSRADLVTDVDHASQKIVKELLFGHFQIIYFWAKRSRLAKRRKKLDLPPMRLPSGSSILSMELLTTFTMFPFIAFRLGFGPAAGLSLGSFSIHE